jgi:transcriptional regulator with XRE-family HTH domain
MDARTVGERVRELRQERGWSLRELAARAEVSHQYVDFLEKGRRIKLDLSRVRKLADAFGLPLAELIGDQIGKAGEEAGQKDDTGGRPEPEFATRITGAAGDLDDLDDLDDLQVNLLRIGQIRRELGPDSLKQLAGVIEAIKREAEREWLEEMRAKRKRGDPGQARLADREA